MTIVSIELSSEGKGQVIHETEKQLDDLPTTQNYATKF